MNFWYFEPPSGGSEGKHGEGWAEVADVAGALSFLAETFGSRPKLQAVAGYSFGGYVGAAAAAVDARQTIWPMVPGSAGRARRASAPRRASNRH